MKFSDIAATVNFILADDGGVTYPASKVYPFIVEAELRIVDRVIGANPVTDTIMSVSGYLQKIPGDGIRLLSVDSIGGSGARLVERSAMDDTDPLWRSAAPSDTAGEYIFDDRLPKQFQTPPLELGVAIELSYDRIPDEYDFVAEPDPVIALDRTYGPAIADYAVWRCLSRADENTPEFGKATAHYQSFMQATGGKAQVNAMQSPKQRGNQR